MESKRRIIEEIDKLAPYLITISKTIHGFAEPGFSEFKSSELQPNIALVYVSGDYGTQLARYSEKVSLRVSSWLLQRNPEASTRCFP